jgi:hypothetical protein
MATKTTEAPVTLEDRIAVLAEFLGYDEEERECLTEGYQNGEIEDGRQSYLVLTDEEADEAVKDRILDSVWAFNSSFLVGHCGLPYEAEEMIRFFQEKKCEGANDTLRSMLKDEDDFVSDAVSSDGRGHFLSGYDGDEAEVRFNGRHFYIYRTN